MIRSDAFWVSDTRCSVVQDFQVDSTNSKRMGWASLPANAWPPLKRVSLHTYFFIPADGGTQGPPVSLQPGELAMLSKPKLVGHGSGILESIFPIWRHI